MGNDSGDTREHSTQRHAQAPQGHLGTKRMGELAELAFMYKASSLGFGVARPYGDSHPYDVLLQYGRRLLRIQVKSVFSTYRRGNSRGYPVNVCQHRKKERVMYSDDDIDFIAAFVAPLETWYVIPVESLSTRKFIRLYPAGKRRKHAGLFEAYHEAWHLLKDKVEKDKAEEEGC